VRRLGSHWLHRRQRSPATRIVGKVRRFFAPLLVVAGVLLWVGIPALAATPKIGTWKGATSPFVFRGVSQPLDIKFSTVGATSGGQRVKGFSLTGAIKIPCTGGEHFATEGWKATVKPKVSKGEFKFTQKLQGSGKELKATGRFTTKTRAKGTVTGTASKPSVTCTTGKLNWEAELK
jgi:hypothetical protein